MSNVNTAISWDHIRSKLAPLDVAGNAICGINMDCMCMLNCLNHARAVVHPVEATHAIAITTTLSHEEKQKYTAEFNTPIVDVFYPNDVFPWTPKPVVSLDGRERKENPFGLSEAIPNKITYWDGAREMFARASEEDRFHDCMHACLLVISKDGLVYTAWNYDPEDPRPFHVIGALEALKKEALDLID